MNSKTHIAIFKSPAKVNLTLDVLGRDPKTGYHFVQTVLHEVPELYDELIFEILDSPEIRIDCDHPEVPTDASNTIHRAATLLQKKYGIQRGAHITLTKKIPPQSGLGGGASNAATTLKALNQLWELGLSDWILRNESATIGIDVPFFITGGCAIAMHYGEQLMHLPTFDRLRTPHHIEVIQTDLPVSTAEAFASLDLSKAGQRNRDTGQLVEILKGEREGRLEPLLHNDFEEAFFEAHRTIRGQHPGAHLSGTGGALWYLQKEKNI